MAKNVIAGNDLKSYKKKYGKAYAKGKLSSFSKKEINSLYGKGLKDSMYIMDKHKKYELIGDKYYERPNTKKKAIIIGASLAVAGAVGGTTAYILINNTSYGQAVVDAQTDGKLIVSGGVAKKGQSYTGTIQVPTEKQETKTLPYIIKEVKTGNKVLSLKASNSNADEDNYYSFDRHNDVAGEIYIHKVEGPISVLVELNDKAKSTRVEKVEIVSSIESVNLNSTVHLSAKVYPEYANNQSISWEVLNEAGDTYSSLASVNRYGDLTAGSTFGKVQIVAISNDTGVRSEPILVSIGEESDNIGFDVFENYGSLNVRVSQNSFTGMKTALNLNVEGRKILSLDPIYTYGHRSIKGAFEGLTNLTSVTLPTTIVEISENCFKDCTGLTEITIPDNVRGIGKNAFAGCTNLTTVKFASNESMLQAIEEGAFSGCTKLVNIGYLEGGIYKIPACLDTIGAKAFLNCGTESKSGTFAFNLTDTTAFLSSETTTSTVITRTTSEIIGENLIGGSAHDLSGYSLVKYSDDYRYMYQEGGAPDEGFTVLFNENVCKRDEVTSLTIPSHMLRINDDASYNWLGRVIATGYEGFYKLSNLKTLELPYTLKSIESYCFEYDTSLTELHIPSNVKNINYYAFNNLTSLTKLTIDEGVETLGPGVFYLDDSIDIKKGNNDEILDSITLPSSVKSIGAWCFSGRTDLEEIVINGNTDENDKKYDWYTVYDYNSSYVKEQDIDLDENEENFEYQHFGTGESGGADNAYTLTTNSQDEGGYAGYFFFKNVIHELSYSGNRDYRYNYFDDSLSRYEFLKSNVEYCYLLDFTKEETKDINCLRIVNHNSSMSAKSLHVEGEEDEVVTSGDILVKGVSVYDESGNLLANVARKSDGTDSGSNKDLLPSIDTINTYNLIDLSAFSNKYDKIYTYVVYDVNNENIIAKKYKKKEALKNVEDELNVLSNEDSSEGEGGYNFIYYMNMEGCRINTDRTDDYESLHFYEEGWSYGDYLESSRVCIDAEKTVTYKFDCAELAEHYGSDDVPYFYTYSVNLQNSNVFYNVEENIGSVSAEYLEEGQKEGEGTDLKAEIPNQTEIRLGLIKEWCEAKDPTPMPTKGTIVIKVKYTKKVSSIAKIYLHSRPDWAESKADDDDIKANVENVDEDDEDKIK